jgi:hypothetical protein
MLGTEPRTLCALGKASTTELHLQPYFEAFNNFYSLKFEFY